MSLIIDLTPAEEIRLSAAAKQTGLAPSEWVRKLVEANLPAMPATEEDVAGADLRLGQEEVSTALEPENAMPAIFARWEEEDAQLTEKEQAENERIYADIEKSGIPRVQI